MLQDQSDDVKNQFNLTVIVMYRPNIDITVDTNKSSFSSTIFVAS